MSYRDLAIECPQCKQVIEITYDVDLPAAFETEHECGTELDEGAIIEIILRNESEERQAYLESLRGL